MVTYLINNYKGNFDSSRTTVTAFANGMLRGGIAAPTVMMPYPVAPVFGGSMVAPNIEDRTRALVRKIKAADAYTEAMGQDMRIVASGTPVVLTAPTLEITAFAGRILEIKWHKGTASGIEIFVDSGSGFPEEGRILTEADGKITVRCVVGSGPVEARVKGIYQKKGEEVGVFGPEYSVVLLP